jgi:hypothetical protein
LSLLFGQAPDPPVEKRFAEGKSETTTSSTQPQPPENKELPHHRDSDYSDQSVGSVLADAAFAILGNGTAEAARQAATTDGNIVEVDEHSWVSLIFGKACTLVLGAPIEIFKLERPKPALFVHYPYAHHYKGYLWTKPAPSPFEPEIVPQQKVDWISIRANIEDGNDFSHLNWVGLRVAVDTDSRIGATTNWNWYHEQFSCGCSADAVIGDVNLTYRLFQGVQYQVHVGAGCRILAEEDYSKTGFNGLLSCDLFPIRPLVVSGLVDGGTLGSVGVIHARATIGGSWHGVEVFGGYDFLRIGSVDLDGPIAGLRFWF